VLPAFSSVSRPPRRASHPAGRSVGWVEHRPHVTSDSPGCLRYAPLPALAPNKTGIHALGLLGTSIGSAVGHHHGPRSAVRAGASCTFHIFCRRSTHGNDDGCTCGKSSIQSERGGLRRFWTPISPMPYLHRLRETGQCMLMVSGNMIRPSGMNSPRNVNSLRATECESKPWSFLAVTIRSSCLPSRIQQGFAWVVPVRKRWRRR